MHTIYAVESTSFSLGEHGYPHIESAWESVDDAQAHIEQHLGAEKNGYGAAWRRTVVEYYTEQDFDLEDRVDAAAWEAYRHNPYPSWETDEVFSIIPLVVYDSLDGWEKANGKDNN